MLYIIFGKPRQMGSSEKANKYNKYNMKRALRHLFNQQEKKGFPTKKTANYYQHLFEMTLMIIGSCPESHPINPYKRLEGKVKIAEHLPGERLLQLYQLLVHASVLFNRTHRLRKQRRLLVSREDIVNALALLRPVAFPQSVLLPDTLKFYYEMLTAVGKEREVTRKELSELLNYHEQKVWRHTIELREAGYIKVSRRKVHGRCYYKIVREEE